MQVRVYRQAAELGACAGSNDGPLRQLTSASAALHLHKLNVCVGPRMSLNPQSPEPKTRIVTPIVGLTVPLQCSDPIIKPMQNAQPQTLLSGS